MKSSDRSIGFIPGILCVSAVGLAIMACSSRQGFDKEPPSLLTESPDAGEVSEPPPPPPGAPSSIVSTLLKPCSTISVE